MHHLIALPLGLPLVALVSASLTVASACAGQRLEDFCTALRHT